MDEIDWRAWVMSLPPLTSGEQLVVDQLARIADWRGVAVVSVDHLVRHTGRHRASVFRALASLEDKGIIRREARRRGQRQASSRIFLTEWATATSSVDSRQVGSGLAAGQEGTVVSRADGPGLAALIGQARAERWTGPASDLLARSLAAEGPLQFRTAVYRVEKEWGVSRSEAESEVIARAWDTVRSHWEAITKAARPWAYLTKVLTIGRSLYPKAWEVYDPQDMTGLESSVVTTSASQGWGIDDFGQHLIRLVDALHAAGMEETIAWSGTYRLTIIAQHTDASRRPRLAANDVRMRDMGIPGECARAWMVLLAGSRSRADSDMTHLNDDELAQRASDVVTLYNERRQAA